MNEDEKKAIEHLNKIKSYGMIKGLKVDGDIDILLNLIKKQQKEIEQEKEKNIKLNTEISKRQWIKVKDNGEIVPLFYVSKDKIVEKMKVIENECKTCKYNHLLCEERKPLSDNIKYCLKLECYDVLKSLLEEN